MTKRQRAAAIEEFFDNIATYEADFAMCGLDIKAVKQKDLHIPLEKLTDKDPLTQAVAIIKYCALRKVRYGR